MGKDGRVVQAWHTELTRSVILTHRAEWVSEVNMLPILKFFCRTPHIECEFGEVCQARREAKTVAFVRT